MVKEFKNSSQRLRQGGPGHVPDEFRAERTRVGRGRLVMAHWDIAHCIPRPMPTEGRVAVRCLHFAHLGCHLAVQLAAAPGPSTKMGLPDPCPPEWIADHLSSCANKQRCLECQRPSTSAAHPKPVGILAVALSRFLLLSQELQGPNNVRGNSPVAALQGGAYDFLCFLFGRTTSRSGAVASQRQRLVRGWCAVVRSLIEGKKPR